MANNNNNNGGNSGNQLVCIKRQEPNLSELFEDMYLNERLVDVTISCSDGQLQAHKLVLAACSSYFSGLFSKLSSPFHYPVIIIKDMQIEDLRLIVDYMYRGQITVSQDKLMKLIKSAEGLHINGLNLEGISTLPVEDTTGGASKASSSQQRNKRAKRSISSSSNHANNNNNNQPIFNRTYQHLREDTTDIRSSPRPDKLMEQSMITGESLESRYDYANNDPTSTRNLSGTDQQILHTPTPSLQSIQHLSLDQQHQQQHHQQHLTNQLQVLSHSLAANRSSITHIGSNGQASNQLVPQQSRGRVHPCNICWKTFREKANLKRHLQVHSLDRVIYTCPDCNKSFSWKDNYIRHTKTAHHMSNVRPQA